MLSRRSGMATWNVTGFARDSVTTNGAACRRLKVMYTSAVDLLCICHTLCHVGEHCELPVLSEFMTPCERNPFEKYLFSRKICTFQKTFQKSRCSEQERLSRN